MYDCAWFVFMGEVLSPFHNLKTFSFMRDWRWQHFKILHCYGKTKPRLRSILIYGSNLGSTSRFSPRRGKTQETGLFNETASSQTFSLRPFSTQSRFDTNRLKALLFCCNLLLLLLFFPLIHAACVSVLCFR